MIEFIGELIHVVGLFDPAGEVSVIVFKGLTVTFVFAEALQPEAFVTISVYVPLITGVAPFITGFCSPEVKPPGPVHR